jgi:hypothetical protein
LNFCRRRARGCTLNAASPSEARDSQPVAKNGFTLGDRHGTHSLRRGLWQLAAALRASPLPRQPDRRTHRHNDGFVLPCAIDRGTVVAAWPSGDARVRVVAADWRGGTDQFMLDSQIELVDDGLSRVDAR